MTFFYWKSPPKIWWQIYFPLLFQNPVFAPASNKTLTNLYNYPRNKLCEQAISLSNFHLTELGRFELTVGWVKGSWRPPSATVTTILLLLLVIPELSSSKMSKLPWSEWVLNLCRSENQEEKKRLKTKCIWSLSKRGTLGSFIKRSGIKIYFWNTKA